MGKGMHYFKDGTKYAGEVHKHRGGIVMTGKTMNKNSKRVYEFKDLNATAKKKARKKSD